MIKKINSQEIILAHDVESHNKKLFKCDKYNYLNYLEYVNVGYVLLSSDYKILSHNKVIQTHLENNQLMRNNSVTSSDYSIASNTLKNVKTISMDDGIESLQKCSSMEPDSILKYIEYFFEDLFHHFIEIDELFGQELKPFIEVNNDIIPPNLNFETSIKVKSKILKIKLSELFQSIKHKLSVENFYRLGVTKIPNGRKFIFLELKIRKITVDYEEIFYEIMTQDVTDVHEAQMTKNQMTYKSLGLAKVAHDFKNPILSMISLLPSDHSDVTDSYISSSDDEMESSLENYPNSQRKKLKRVPTFSDQLNKFDKNTLIKNFSSYMLTLIEDFNVFAKMDIETVIDNPSMIVEIPVSEDIELRPILEFSVNIFKIRQLNEKDKQKINISLIIENNVPVTVRVNETKLKQVMVNLLSNSYKFTISGSIVVRAKVFLDDEYRKFLRITIQDTGVGIRKEDQSKLFTPFKMIDSAKNLNSHGSGLGLLIIKEILNNMNSDIKFVSEHGVGTSFWFDIPINSAITLLCQKSLSSHSESLSFIDQNMNMTESLANVFKRLNTSMLNDTCSPNELGIGNSSNKFELFSNRNINPFGLSPNNSNLNNTNSHDKIIIKSARSLLRNPNLNLNGKGDTRKIEELIMARKESLKDNYKPKNLIRFLICDDEEISLVSLQRLIVAICQNKLINYDISIAKNGIECLYMMNVKLSKNEPIDVIFIDDQMSIMNGGMTLKIIKELIELKKIPSLLRYIVTSNSDSNTHKDFLQNGCDEVVPKPIPKSKILQIINEKIIR